jgi:hypothetical protein
LRGASGWAERPTPERCRELAAELLQIEGIDSLPEASFHWRISANPPIRQS